MKKRLVSIILTVFLVLSMMPFAAFADNAIVCPACGGSVTKQERRLLTAHDDFYKCDKCGKWAWVNKLGSLSLFSVGDQQILDAADSSAIVNFSFNNGHLIPAEKAPSGIGRKDLPGYADDNGTPIYNVSGKLQLVIEPYGLCADYATSGQFIKTPSLTSFVRGSGGSGTSYPSDVETVIYSFVAPCDGVYYASSLASPYDYGYISIFYNNDWHEKKLIRYTDKVYFTSITLKAGETCYYLDLTGYYHYVGSSKYWPSGKPYRYKLNPVTIFVDPVGESSVTNNNTITINNNTWNGNIYTDNSTNLTYIYPQYTTVNEKNETVTNISNNPIIYNNETKQYYTYDQTTKNYYYITYNSDPAPSPTPTPDPTDKPGGSISTPETGKPGGDTGDTTGILAVLVEIRDNMIQGFLDIKAAFVAGFAELSANFTLAIENLNVNIQNIFNKKFPDQSTPETAQPTPTPSPEPTETPSPTDPPSPTPSPSPAPTGKPDGGGDTNNFWNIFIGGGSDDGTDGDHKGIFWALVSLILALIAFFTNLFAGVAYLFPFLPEGVVMTINTCLFVVFLFVIIKFIMRSK